MTRRLARPRAGSRSGHSASTTRSRLTVRSATRRLSSSRTRVRWTSGVSTARPSWRTSSGPSARIRTTAAGRAGSSRSTVAAPRRGAGLGAVEPAGHLAGHALAEQVGEQHGEVGAPALAFPRRPAGQLDRPRQRERGGHGRQRHIGPGGHETGAGVDQQPGRGTRPELGRPQGGGVPVPTQVGRADVGDGRGAAQERVGHPVQRAARQERRRSRPPPGRRRGPRPHRTPGPRRPPLRPARPRRRTATWPARRARRGPRPPRRPKRPARPAARPARSGPAR